MHFLKYHATKIIFYYILAKDELYLDAPKEKPIDRKIVHSSLVDVDYEYYYNMYIADTPYVRAMTNFLCTRLKLSAQRAEDIVSDLILIIT